MVFSPGEEELAETFQRCCRDGARLLLIDDSELQEAPNAVPSDFVCLGEGLVSTLVGEGVCEWVCEQHAEDFLLARRC